MTNGASQGLFVIVAVVIFGIFVLISYMLFRDKLKTGLADIFDDSISQATDDLTIWTNLSNLNLMNVLVENKIGSEYTLKADPKANIHYWGDRTPYGLVLPNVAVKAGETIKVSFEIKSSKDAQFIIDNNMSTLMESTNDFYSNPTIKVDNIVYKTTDAIYLKANRLTNITYTLTNSSDKLYYDYSAFGIVQSDTTDNIFKISNTKYTIITK